MIDEKKLTKYIQNRINYWEDKAADVAKIRHGKWIDIMFVKADDPDGGYWISRCSECDIPNYKHTNYCPNCGARMEEVRKK